MDKRLKDLNDSVGVKGSLVMTRDGVVVAADLGEALDQETVAALASSILNACQESVGDFNLEKLSRLTLSAKHGRLIFEIMESLVLVVVTDKDIDLDITRLEIQGVARRLQRMVRISV